MVTKKQIRADAKLLRNSLPKEEREAASCEICSVLCNMIREDGHQHIYLYYPLGTEADILPLAEKLLLQGVNIAFPKVYGSEMSFIQIHDLKRDFKEGAFHIMEPVSDSAVDWQDACVLVPGLSFDRFGNRIGYGKGYYDRYFSGHAHGQMIGVTFDKLMAENILMNMSGAEKLTFIPAEEHDLKMHAVCTEKKLLMLGE